MKEEFKNEVAEEFEAAEGMNIEVAECETDEATEQEKFEPMLIGMENKRGQLAAEEAYGLLTRILNELKPALENAIFQNGKSPSFTGTTELFEFIKAQYPDKWIIRKYIQQNGISVPGLDIDRIIELGLVKVEQVHELLNLRQMVLKQLEVVKKTGFYYPVGTLFDDITGKFEITDNLFMEAEKRFCRVTQSAAQNEVVTIFNELCEALNKLNLLNIIRGKNGPAEFTLLNLFIDIVPAETDYPFHVKDTLFYTQRLYNYRVKGVQSRNPVTPDQILS